MADEKLTAATRLEKLLDNIAGGDNEVTPATRLEKFLSYIADAMEGGGSGGTQNDFMTVVILRNADGTYSSNKTYDEILSHFDEDEYMVDIPIICIYCDRVSSIFIEISFDGIGDSDELYFNSTTVNLVNTTNKTLNVQTRVFIMDSSNNITLGTDTTVTGNLN